MPAANVLGYDFDLNLCYSAVAVASIYLLKRMFFSSNSERDKNSVVKRRMSFSSSLLIDGGGFPKDVGVCSPIINIAFYFNCCPTVDDIVEQLESVLQYERFKCTPVQDKHGNWIFDSKTQPDIRSNHINSSEVEGEVEVTKELNRITASDLSGYGERPLWVVHRIVNKGVGISMVVFRIHHVITDGIGLLDVFTNMFLDSRTNKPIHNPISESMRSADKKGGNKISLLANMISCFFKILALPLSSFDTNIAFSSQDKKSLKMGRNMKTVIFPTVRLDFIKALKNKAGVTVNDIMLSATGGAIRRYCEKRGEALPADILCRALMPVAFPRPSSEKEDPQTALRNKWAFMSVSTPVKEDSSKDRVVNCNKMTNFLKNSPMAYVQFWIQTNLLPLLPKSQGQQTAYDMFARHSMIFSNVLGTDAIPLFCNEKVMGVQVVFPNLIPQVILMSMGKQVFYNMVVDGDVVKDADLLGVCYVEELESIAEAYGVDHNKDAMMSSLSAGGKFGIVDLP